MENVVSTNFTFDESVSSLKGIHARSQAGDAKVAALTEIVSARDEVIPHYQRIFARPSEVSEADFRSFLIFKNNRHWMSLQRLGPAICSDMDRLREALEKLLDEKRPIQERLNELVPASGPAFVPQLSKAVLTPILMIVHPDRYGVWNRISESAMNMLNLWPECRRGMPFGDRYFEVNTILNEVASAVGVDLWTLDALLWRAEAAISDDDSAALSSEDDWTNPEAESEGIRFGLERHLQDFLRDNWDSTELGSEWKLYEEDGDPEAGYEYPCGIGRIDLLARHRSEPRWLVIELKRRQTSDQTVGQVLRYMGWVREHMAEPTDAVEGLVIAHQGEESLHYALKMATDIRLRLYEVDFRLKEPRP